MDSIRGETFQLEKLLAEREAAGAAWLPFLKVPSLRLGIYTVSADDQATHQPHAMDEVYYAVSGRGMVQVEGEDQPVEPGTLAFVAAGREHHFHSIAEPLTLLVFFANSK